MFKCRSEYGRKFKFRISSSEHVSLGPDRDVAKAQVGNLSTFWLPFQKKCFASNKSKEYNSETNQQSYFTNPSQYTLII